MNLKTRRATTPGSPSPPAPSQGLDALTEVAMGLRWSWNQGADELWRRLEPTLWALTSWLTPRVPLWVTRQPDLYSAKFSGVGGSSGVGLVEIFLMP